MYKSISGIGGIPFIFNTFEREMSMPARNLAKKALRKRVKEVLGTLTAENKGAQSEIVTQKVLESSAFKNSKRISIYLSLVSEVNTSVILSEMFRLKKEVFVPSYSGNSMCMLKISDLEDFEKLPLTKWKIKQPNPDESRENANETGGLDLVLMPGVAFTKDGGRMGHGMGYYDKYLAESFVMNPHRKAEELRGDIDRKLEQKKTILIGLAFREQIIRNSSELPLDSTDVLLDQVVTADD